MKMPHKCVRCGKTYDNNSPELLKGCSCGSRVFVYLRPGQKQEKDVSWLEKEFDELAEEKPVVIDEDAVENIRVVGKGSYELNISALMRGERLVVKSDKDVYYIKLPGNEVTE